MNSYNARIKRAYEGEIVGGQLYGHLSVLSEDASCRQKLSTIAEVEGRTRGVLEPMAMRLGIEANARDIQARVERRVAEWRQLNWLAFIRKALAEWPPYISEFEAMERLAPECDKVALRLVVNHEMALVEFARLEHAGSAQSLEPLRKFLRESLQRP
jgi:hypothetical protein